MTKYSEDKMIPNVYNNASKLKMQTELQEEINKSTLQLETSTHSFSN